jgi:hypothetical protein
LPTSPRVAHRWHAPPEKRFSGGSPSFSGSNRLPSSRRRHRFLPWPGKTLSTEEVFISAENKGCQPDLGGGFRFKHETKNQPVHAEFDPTDYVSGAGENDALDRLSQSI